MSETVAAGESVKPKDAQPVKKQKMGQYCKYFRLGEFRKYSAWKESKDGWKKPPGWEDKEWDAELTDDTPVVLQDDFTVTRGSTHKENVLWGNITEEWKKFCMEVVGFKIPDDLMYKYPHGWPVPDSIPKGSVTDPLVEDPEKLAAELAKMPLPKY